MIKTCVSKKNRRGERERQGKLVGWNVRDQEEKRTNKQVKQTFLGGLSLLWPREKKKKRRLNANVAFPPLLGPLVSILHLHTTSWPLWSENLTKRKLKSEFFLFGCALGRWCVCVCTLIQLFRSIASIAQTKIQTGEEEEEKKRRWDVLFFSR